MLQAHALAEFPELAGETGNLLFIRGRANPQQACVFALEYCDSLDGIGAPEAELPVALDLARERGKGLLDPRLLMADKAEIAACAHEFYRCTPDRRGFQHASHLEVIGGNQATVADLFVQHVCDPVPRKRGRPLIASHIRVTGMIDDYHF